MTIVDIVSERFLNKKVRLSKINSSNILKTIKIGIVTDVTVDGDRYSGYDIYLKFEDDTYFDVSVDDSDITLI